jgi:hypothetical protein
MTGAQAIMDLAGTIVLDPANHRNFCKTFCSYAYARIR